MNYIKNSHSTLTSMALGRPPFLIQGWTSISSFFCSSEKRGWLFCSRFSFSLSSLSTFWMSLQAQQTHKQTRSVLHPTLTPDKPLWGLSLRRRVLDDIFSVRIRLGFIAHRVGLHLAWFFVRNNNMSGRSLSVKPKKLWFVIIFSYQSSYRNFLLCLYKEPVGADNHLQSPVHILTLS